MTTINEQIPSKVNNDELVAERRADLIAAATELFLHQGFHKTTVREIANAAGWQMGKLYLYISCKEDVLFLINEHIMRRVHEELLTLPHFDSTRQTLETAIRRLILMTHEMRREIRFFYRESASHLPQHLRVIQELELQNREIFAAIIRRGIGAGEFQPVDEVLLAHDIIMIGTMWALKHWALKDHLSLDGYIELQLDLILSHLLPAPNQPPSREPAIAGRSFLRKGGSGKAFESVD